MCGIAGFIESPRVRTGGRSPIQRLNDMLTAIVHRGPDDWGASFYGWQPGEAAPTDEHIAAVPEAGIRLALGHRRLSIIDLSPAGRQPMSTPGGDYTIIFNGEIYNYVELRGELPRDIIWRTRTDTEVLLHAWRVWGEAALPRLDGMFAFALYDRRQRRLILARDRVGVKPLYYAAEEGRFFFGSEPRAILAGLGTRGHLNPARTAEFLVMGKSDHDAGTFHREVRQLPGGHWLEVSADALPSAPHPYWSPAGASVPEGADIPLLTRDAIHTAVLRQLRSDVPVGSCLSGGLDSGALAVTVGELLGVRVKDFTALTLFAPGFPDDESPLARKSAAAAGGMKWVAVEQNLNTLEQDVQRMLTAMGEPVSTLSMLAQFKLFERARELGLKVMLDGQGGDEIWLGYPRVAQRIIVEKLRRGNLSGAAREWLGLRRNLALPLLKSLLGNIFFSSPEIAGWRNRSRLAPFVSGDLLAQVSQAHLRDYYNPRDIRSQQVAELTRYTLPRLLRFEDRNSMAFSIEARVPHLSNGTIDLGLSLPPHWQVRQGWTKYALRRAMEGRLPDEILWNRVKRGFAVPQKLWVDKIRAPLKGWLGELPFGSPLKPKAVLTALERGRGGEPWLWRVVSVGLWMRFCEVGV